MIKKNYLLTPGPTPVPAEALLAEAQPIIHHRTPQFSKIYYECHEMLKEIFMTEGDVFTIVSSGTGAFEAAVVNFHSPGDKVIVIDSGNFGGRWVKMSKAFGLEPVVIKLPWGESVRPEQIEKALKENPDAVSVQIVLSETSTGVCVDLEPIGKIVAKTNAILIVDAVSGLGAVPCKTDEWGLDVVVSGSQKAFMIPPGLGFISVSEKAWKKYEKAACPRFYFDLKAYKKSMANKTSPFTPAVSLMQGLHKALLMLREEGIDFTIDRHRWLAKATRAGITALGLELYAKDPGDVVTAIKVPENVDGNAFVKKMRDEYGVTIANGQGDIKGKIFRIAHLGYMENIDVLIALSAAAMCLKEMGADIPLGAGVKAAQEVLLEYRQQHLANTAKNGHTVA